MTSPVQAPIEMSLVLVCREDLGASQVLLGEKLRGFGRGRIVAPGGKIDAGETPVQAASRELREETGLLSSVAALEPCALLDFTFSENSKKDAGASPSLRAHVFMADQFAGEPTDSDEIAVAWVNVQDIDYSRMWVDARVWMPRVLRGERPHVAFRYGPDGVNLEDVQDLGSVPA